MSFYESKLIVKQENKERILKLIDALFEKGVIPKEVSRYGIKIHLYKEFESLKSQVDEQKAKETLELIKECISEK